MTVEMRSFQANPLSLDGKIIIVTGAGDGIGKTAALTFAEHGATVVLMGRTLSKLESVYDTIEKNGGPTPAIFPINFEGANEHDYAQLKTAIEETFGKADGVLLNAGELGPRTPLASYQLEQWEKVLHVNVTSQFLLAKSLLPLLEKSESGRMIFTSSTVGIKGKAYWGCYAVSKAASDNLMEVLADELEHTNIRVNSVNPGAVRTKMRAQAFPAEDPSTVAEAISIMPTYLYLMGKNGDSIHGQLINAQEVASP